MIIAQSLTKDRAIRLVEACFADLKQEADVGFLPLGPRPDFELDEQREYARQRIEDLEAQVKLKDFGGELRVRAMLLSHQSGLRFDELSPAVQADLMEGVARAHIEQAKLAMFRLDDRLSPYVASDPLFRSIGPTLVKHHLDLGDPDDITIREACDRYLDFGREQWVAKTVLTRRRHLLPLLAFAGEETLIKAVTPAQLRAYRDALKTMQARLPTKDGLTFAQMQTTTAKDQIHPKTAFLRFETAISFFKWAKSEAHVQVDPSLGLANKMPKAKVKGEKTRKPFGPEELTTIFSSPIYQGSETSRSRNRPGPYLVYDAKFWVPLVGLYTGMRLSEIIQLHFPDVKDVGGIPCIDVSEDGGGAQGIAHKHVKSAAGVRRIPLHPDLIELGFLRFVAKRRKAQKGNGRIFNEVKYGADGMPSTVFSKWFGRFLSSIGLNDPSLVFHSFRHTFQDAMKDGLSPAYVIDKVFGHSDQAPTSYGEGASLEVCQDAVVKMKSRVDVLKLIKPMP